MSTLRRLPERVLPPFHKRRGMAAGAIVVVADRDAPTQLWAGLGRIFGVHPLVGQYGGRRRLVRVWGDSVENGSVCMEGVRRVRASPEHPLVVRITDALAQLDPYGLRPGAPDSAPADEYDLEARDIARVLQRGEIALAELDDIWNQWFGELLSAKIGADRARDFVARLNTIDRS